MRWAQNANVLVWVQTMGQETLQENGMWSQIHWPLAGEQNSTHVGYSRQQKTVRRHDQYAQHYNPPDLRQAGLACVR